MKKQNNLFGIRTTLILVLGFTLVSGYAFAQTATQYVYTANGGGMPNANSVSEITAYNNGVTNVRTCLRSPAQGIALNDLDTWAAVTQTGCTGALGSECVSIVDLQCVIAIIPTANCSSNLSYVVTSVATGRGAQSVAITPLISTATMGTDRFAYVTTGMQYVSIVTYHSTNCFATVQTREFTLPQGIDPDNPPAPNPITPKYVDKSSFHFFER